MWLYLSLTSRQAVEWGCEESVVLLDDAVEGEDSGHAHEEEWFADVQHDFMNLCMLPKVCGLLLEFLRSEHIAK